MGSFDGAEVCELVGLYILHILGEKYSIEGIGLYRDDGLACLHNSNGPKSDRIRKDLIKTFKDVFNLFITIDTNLKQVNFLDVTFDLSTGLFKP